MINHWTARAACGPDSGQQPDLWFSTRREDRKRARHICMTRCPVIEQCRAAGADMPVGTWGGEFRNSRTPGPSLTKPFLGGEHGTEAGYKRHLAEGTVPCARCQIAHQFTNRELYQAAMARKKGGAA